LQLAAALGRPQYAEIISGMKNKESNKISTERIIREYAPNEETIAKSRENLTRAKPVAELTGNEFEKGETDLYTQVSDYFDSTSNSVHNEELGDINLTRSGARDDIAHGVGRLKAITFAAVPDVLKNGVIIHYSENHKERGYDSAVFAAPVNIGGNRYYVAAVVNRSHIKPDKIDSQRFYLHEVYSNKKTSELFKSVEHLLQDEEHSSSDVSNNKISLF